MEVKDLPCGNGHVLRDNQVGDRDLICPTLGNLRFVHLGQIYEIDAEKVSCACGEKLGPVEWGPH